MAEQVQNFLTTIQQNVPELNIGAKEDNAVEWKKWWQAFRAFLLVTDLEKEPENRKVAIMLQAIGNKGLEIYHSFKLDVDEVTLTEVKSKFDDYFVEPQRNLTMLRHEFFTRYQKPGESIDSFVTDLENKSHKCEFDKLRDSLVRDIFIANMCSSFTNVRQRLLEESDPSLEKTLSLAKTVISRSQGTSSSVKSRQRRPSHYRQQSPSGSRDPAVGVKCRQNEASSSDSNNPIVCGEEALSVGKDEPNKDEDSPPTSDIPYNRPNISDEDIVCKCGLPAKRLTVKKEGSNKGRQFYNCSKNRKEQCTFYQWADEPPRSSNNFSPMPAPVQSFKKPRGGVKRSYTERKTSGPAKQRKCSNCGKTGHYRKSCQQNIGN